MLHRFNLALICIVTICMHGVRLQAQGQRLPDIIYMDQPTGIPLSLYEQTWPLLKPYIARIKASQSAAVEADLRQRSEQVNVSDGELNLLAQLEWQRGALDAADVTVARAVSIGPKQSLNAYQQAMVNFAHLRHASGMFDGWKWQQRSRDAYQRTFDLDPLNISARYYLAYTYMNTPSIGGGDKKKALKLSDEGVALGQNGFYVVRADAHRLRGEIDAANADYDLAIKFGVFKLSAFLEAAGEELKRKKWQQAKRYLDWAMHCRPDASKVDEGFGDYYAATANGPQAVHWYENAIQKDAHNSSARRKLAGISRSSR